MGSRGPAPMPRALKLLRGESRPSRLDRTDPKPRGDRPVMPSDMAPAAQRVWRRVMYAMRTTGVITRADTDVLRIYCQAVVEHERAATMLGKSGPIIRGSHRQELVKNPLHQVVRDNALLVRALARELGLTPAARQGLEAPWAAAAADDPMRALLEGDA